MKDIRKLNRKKAALDEIQEFIGIVDYLEFAEYVKEQEDAGILKPVKSSRLNGKKPALYQSYHIITTPPDYKLYQEELLYQLDFSLNPEYYLKNMEKYKEDRSYVLLLSRYLKKMRESLNVPASLNERSFEIFHREKFLQKEGGMRILKNLSFGLEELNIYQTSEPLAYYSHFKSVPQTVLIIENKDTFYSMRRHLLAGGDTIFGEEIGTVIYGGGKAIYKAFSDFKICVEDYLSEKKNKMLYFGDLDYEGIIIYEGLYEQMKGVFEIDVFCDAYEAMIQKASKDGVVSLKELPDTKEGQNRSIGTKFMNSFSEKTQGDIRRILEEGKYIPQEILQMKDF